MLSKLRDSWHIRFEWSILEHAASQWAAPGHAAVLALLVYAVFALVLNPSFPLSKFAYYNYLADAFLHGQLALRLLPISTHDLVYFDGQYFLYWAPFPALIMMPFVAIFGVQFGDIPFTVAVGALNVWLVAWLLRQACKRNVINLSIVQRGWLVLFFALGTVHITLAPYGRVWFTGQLVGFACIAVSYLAALSWMGSPAFLGCGLGLACALLTRDNLILTGVWPAIYLFNRHRYEGWQRIAGYVLVGAAPIAIAVGLLGVYDLMRFGNVLDNGLAHQLMDDILVADFQKYGMFNLHYVPTNLYYQFLAYPLPPNDQTWLGGGLFWLSPVFLAAGWGVVRGRPRWSAWLLLATCLLASLPILFLIGTGWIQFGPRYLLDLTVPLLLLTAMGVRYWSPRILGVLTLLSVAQYLVGTAILGLALSTWERLP